MSIVSPLQHRFTIQPCAAMAPHPAASRDSGRIEPLSVTAADARSRKYTLLDGHLRLVALRELGRAEAMCLVATDDEAYTYNNRLNRLASVQEHLMIGRAIERGVPPLLLAKALDVKIDQIAAKVTLLDELCPEAIALLKDQHFSLRLRILRKMKPTRQVECVELMLAANSVTASYASALPRSCWRRLPIGWWTARGRRGPLA